MKTTTKAKKMAPKAKKEKVKEKVKEKEKEKQAKIAPKASAPAKRQLPPQVEMSTVQSTPTLLPAVHTTSGGQPVSYLWMTTMRCTTCKKAQGGAPMGVARDLRNGGFSIECSNLDCRQTVHLLVSQMPVEDQKKYREIKRSREQ